MADEFKPYPIAELRAALLIRLSVVRVQKRWILKGLAKGTQTCDLALIEGLTNGRETLRIDRKVPCSGPGFGYYFPPKDKGAV